MSEPDDTSSRDDANPPRRPGPLVCDRCGKPHSSDTLEDHGHFSQVVAPLLVAVTIPTVALIATTETWPGHPSARYRLATAAVFIAASGFLLAAYQFSLGSIANRVPGWLRATLTYTGMVGLVAGLIMFVVPLTNTADGSTLTIIASAVLALGTGIPIAFRISEWAHHQKLRKKANDDPRSATG